MKKVAILLALFCMLTVTASAAYIPEDVISENRDGRQLIVKTYMLPPDADPSGLVEEPFEVEGYSYHHLETVKEEQTFEDSKIQQGWLFRSADSGPHYNPNRSRRLYH